MANSKVLLGFVAGAAAGALAGILFAPDSGAVTRRKITGRYNDLEDVVDETIDDVKDAASDAAADIKSGANAIKDKVDDKFQQWKDNYKSELS